MGEGLFLFSGKLPPRGAAASTTALTVSDAEAQTAGMERRQERRTGTVPNTGTCVYRKPYPS